MQNDFDIFDFLSIGRREDVLHTPMLAGLLDPYGAHGLGEAFLRKFVELIAPERSEEWSNSEWIVRQQQRVPGGRIDILLLCPRAKMAIVIETKFDAAEPKYQMRCYKDWLLSLTPNFVDNRLVFLTPTRVGSRSLPNECIPLGYTSILQILRECLAQVNASEFQPAIHAYCVLLGKLLNIELASDAPTGVQSREFLNLFRFLRIGRREAVLHTRMIAGLLNPRAAHGQASRFLKPFLRTLDERLAADCDDCDWQVTAEAKILKGRLDILLECKQRGVLVAVENKIDAPEGPQQMERYGAWMDSKKCDYPTQFLVFLTSAGSQSLSGGSRLIRRLSYAELLSVIETGAAELRPTPFRDILQQYLQVLRSIVPMQGQPSSRLGRRLSPATSHSTLVTEFLTGLVRKWDELPVEGFMRPPILRQLKSYFKYDNVNAGKYSSVEVWHTSWQIDTSHPLVLPRVEVLLGNRRVMGVWVGLHWQNTRSLELATSLSKLPESSALLNLVENFYSVQEPQRKGLWFGIAERLEYPRSDGALVSILHHHPDDIHRAIVTILCGIWSLCGDKLIALNHKLSGFTG